ncbi:hypothetical protein [Ruegeria sp. HKCCA5463]|uniref:hypothetical protein n=1 Tax=Ruegeria sp. HKCCA5463 TaxID=2682994 RepID=UPI0014879CCC|nr:hypothetical protein [Ruegeria sp. HKCCA5463]
MSVLTALPLLEVASAAFGLGAAALSWSLANSSKRKLRRSSDLAEYLNSKEAWRKFERNRLREILSDHEVSENEWQEILDEIDLIIDSDTNSRESVEKRARYKNRSNKSKRMLVSDFLKSEADKLLA